MNAISLRRFGFFFVLASTLGACGTESPTEAVTINGFPSVPDGGPSSERVTVYRVWYSTTLFSGALAPGAESDAQRTVPGKAVAYAVLAPGWEPSSATPPSSFVAVQSKHGLSVSRGDMLRITVSDSAFTGRCGGSAPLDQDDADFVTERIFPAEFAGATYDPASCTSTPLSGRERDAATKLDSGQLDATVVSADR